MAPAKRRARHATSRHTVARWGLRGALGATFLQDAEAWGEHYVVRLHIGPGEGPLDEALDVSSSDVPAPAPATTCSSSSSSQATEGVGDHGENSEGLCSLDPPSSSSSEPSSSPSSSSSGSPPGPEPSPDAAAATDGAAAPTSTSDDGSAAAPDAAGASSSSSSSSSSSFFGAGASPEGHHSIVPMNFGGYSFRCARPTPGGMRRARELHLLKQLSMGRAAGLKGSCLNYDKKILGEDLKVCPQDYVQLGSTFSTALHTPNADKPLRRGGVLSSYVGVSEFKRHLHVSVNYTCLMPGGHRTEPTCRPGDMAHLSSPPSQVGTYVVAKEHPKDILELRPVGGHQIKYVPRYMTEDLAGRPCDSVANMQAEPAAGTILSAALLDSPPIGAEVGDSASPSAPAAFLNVTVGASTFCHLSNLQKPGGENPLGKDLPGVEFSRLLAPIHGKCYYAILGWWTYEVCWPWRIRQLHYGLHGGVEVPAVTLGSFRASSGFQKHRATSPTGGERYELHATLEGEACHHTVQTWWIEAGRSKEEFDGVGGSFNPIGVFSVEGELIKDETNVDGCRPYTEAAAEKLRGKIVLAKRGNCWFHVKAMRAQAAGAIGVIVYNDKRLFVQNMEGVDELMMPLIPTVLVETDVGTRLLELVGQTANVYKYSTDGQDISEPFITNLIMHCANDWQDRGEVCGVGEVVDVKIVAPLIGEPESRWPTSAVRWERGIVAEVFSHNQSLLIAYPSTQASEELPTIVTSNLTFREGVPCSAVGGAYIDRMLEPLGCSTDVVMHVPALCAHRDLVPVPSKETQEITCVATETTRQRLAERSLREEQEAEDDLSVDSR